MSEVVKIVQLLKSEAIEKQIAAAIVLGELKAKGPGVVEGLGEVLASGVPLLQVHALDALARVGAKKALPAIFPLLATGAEDVRRAATRAIASVGDEVVPIIKQKMASASPDERRALDAALAELGGKDAFTALIKGLASSNGEAAKAAALAVRQQVKSADGHKRRSYLAETEKFLETQKKKENAHGAVAAAVKILGYLEDEKTVPTLLVYASDEKQHPSVRQEAIAFRFALQTDKPSAKVIDALVKAAEAPDRALAQTALHTLGSLKVSDETAKRLEKLALHTDFDRARFVLELLGRMGGHEAARVLTRVLTTADRRYAEAAAAGLNGKEDAVPALAKALLETDNPDRAWVLRNVLRPAAKKIASGTRKQILEVAMERLGGGERGWEALLDVARDAEPDAVAEALRALAQKLRRSSGKEERARSVYQILCKSDRATDDDRYAYASLELSKSNLDTRPASRAGDESLRLLGLLVKSNYDVAKALRKDRAVDLDHLYYIGFHFTELDHPVGEELLEEVVRKGGRAKVAKMAKNKLALSETSA